MNNLQRAVTTRWSGMLRGEIHVTSQVDIIRNSHLRRILCTLSHRQNIICLANVQRRGFLFKSEKSDIIKNEIEEILKTDKDPQLMGRGWTKDVKESDYSGGNNQNEPPRGSNQNEYKNKRGKFKRLFIFIAFQSIPIVGLMYLFKYIESVKLAELNLTFDSSDDIIKEALKLIRGDSKCFCMYREGEEIKTFFVDPLGPEESEVNYERAGADTTGTTDVTDATNATDVVKAELAPPGDHHEGANGGSHEETPTHPRSTQTNDLTKIVLSLNKPLMQRVMNVKSTREFPLNYLYFCVSKNTDIYNFLKNRNELVSLLYSDDAKNVYVTLTGSASIIENEVIRNVIWTDRWSYLISDDLQENYVLIKFTPSTVSLKTIGFKNQHWKSNIVRRSMTDDKLAWVKG
ncbi:Uncharacterized protein PCOAH_00052040 [Plasmodium coatneyi]|uniref:General stress protein FMN-binding split barrel domain-containing protein n=1 Tax=Plasmodium coatneyi TaxID=208452 RepID=A0A1B1E7T2_9APIC|nr:Uncharacterized protein PCOAH_00052040 [Plasmodium coatneyi]ANQ11061.1 Uncharacterized protein PCOAH_00052040 [Plasmodium coatneyi]